jgi:hypothetical protein
MRGNWVLDLGGHIYEKKLCRAFFWRTANGENTCPSSLVTVTAGD